MRRGSRLAVGALAALPMLLGLTSANPAQSGSAALGEPCLAPGQVWTLDGPSPRRSPGMADDPDHGQVVLFGGWNGRTALGDTWTWDGTAWTEQHPADSPSPRYGAGLTYDPATGEVLLTGGFDGVTSFRDTWVWDGSNWIERDPEHVPPGGPTLLAFDTASQLVVWYWAEYHTSNQTWTWDGTDWHELTVDFDGRSFAAMSSDGDHALLFGGGKYFFEDLILTRTTYEWNGATWRRRTPANKPARRFEAQMAYDAARHQLVMFGGKQWNQVTLGDTAIWDGANWTPRNPTTRPGARYWGGMAYDSTRQQVVLFGGTRGFEFCHYDDTWTWDGANWTEH